MTRFGTRTTFQIFAVFTLFMGCIYYFINRFYISKLPQGETNEICKKEPKKVKELSLTVIEDKPLSNGINNAKHEQNLNPLDVNKKASTENLSESHDNPTFQGDEGDKTEKGVK